jgi:aspartate kinase
MKFGGTSVGSADAIRQAVAITQGACDEAERVVVIVSAMSGVTDLLLTGANAAAGGNSEHYTAIVAALRDKHQVAAETLVMDEYDSLMAAIDQYLDRFTSFCDSVQVLGEVTPRALDFIASLGERMNARMVAAALRAAGTEAEAVNATRLILTDAKHQNASPLLEPTCERVQAVLDPLLDERVVPVVTGFIGATEDGVTTTLGRGGSDYSGALVGACLDSDEVWIWTDVDGVMSTDPKIVPDARTIPTLTTAEVAELAYFGAKVLHPKTIQPLIEAGIPLRTKNTFNPDHPGTLVVKENGDDGGAIKAVTIVRDLALITVEGMGMLGVPGIAGRTFTAVAETLTNILLISQASSEQSICFAVPEAQADRVVDALQTTFARELERRDINRIWAQKDVDIVTVVGAGMRKTPGVAGRIFTATGQHGVNVIAIAQGSSEHSISLVVDASDGDEALRCIHELAVAPAPANV